MSSREERERIHRYVNGDVGEEERHSLETLFESGEENYMLKSMLEKEWDKFVEEEPEKGIDLNHVRLNIHDAIWTKEHFKKNMSYRRFMVWYGRIAAIFLIPLLIGGFFAYSSLKDTYTKDIPVQSVICAPMGARVEFNLPDGTKGMLNSGSKLTYSMPFSNDRNVNLDGEAWFEVISDKAHPFSVYAGEAIVKVHGTKFNVNAYSDIPHVEVALKEGEIEFVHKEMNIDEVLKPSEGIFIDGNNFSKETIDVDKYFGWVDGKLIFRGDNLVTVVQRLEQWYNVKIEIADESLKQYSFRATFEDDSLEDVMMFLSMTSPIKYVIIPQSYDAEGNWVKQKVIISSAH